jgi:hypothetical protein
LIPVESVGCRIHGGSMPEGVGHRVSKGVDTASEVLRSG